MLLILYSQMYLEFIILIFDYFKTLNSRIVVYEIIIPLIVSILVFFSLLFGKNTSVCFTFGKNALTLLGILLGFSITIITILTTGNSKNLVAIQKKQTKHSIGTTKVTLFNLLLINFTYSVVLEIIFIIVLLLYPFVLANFTISLISKIIVFSILTGGVIHVLLLTMRNLTGFYLILIKK